MTLSPLVLLHVVTAGTALLAGTASLLAGKGSRLHRRTGNVFFVTMLCMSTTGAYLAAQAARADSVLAGLLSAYLVATAWIAVRRPPRSTGPLDQVLLAAAALIAAGGFHTGWATAHDAATHSADDYVIYFVFAGIAMIAGCMDARLLWRGGIAGAQRIVRHLWRMGFALSLATMSFFIGQQRVFPAAIRHSGLLPVPVFLVVGLVLFWFVRVLSAKGLKAVGATRQESRSGPAARTGRALPGP